MSQPIAVLEYNEHKMLNVRVQACQSEKTSRADRANHQDQKCTGHVHAESMNTQPMRAVEVDDKRTVTKLGQVMMFLIELADQDALDCRRSECSHGAQAR